MQTTDFPDLIALVRQLPVAEQWTLVEVLTRELRARSESLPCDLEVEFAALAADADIQREMIDIEREFSVTESDGLPETS